MLFAFSSFLFFYKFLVIKYQINQLILKTSSRGLLWFDGSREKLHYRDIVVRGFTMSSVQVNNVRRNSAGFPAGIVRLHSSESTLFSRYCQATQLRVNTLL